MKKIWMTVVALAVFLSSCGTFEVSIERHEAQAAPASSLTPTGPAPLNMDSTSDQIRRTLLDSPARWQTIFMDAQVTASGQDPRRVQAWVDQSNLSIRVLSGPLYGAAETFRVADGMTLLDFNIATGASSISPFIGQTLPLPYTPAPVNPQPGVAEPHPLSTSVDPSMGVVLFPSDIAQNEGTFKPVGMEVIAYQLCLVVEWTYVQNALPSYRAWVDVSNGVFLRYQQFEKSGGTDVLSEVNVTRVDYNLPFSRDLFSPMVAFAPDFSSDPLVVAAAAVTPALLVEEDSLGKVYAFVADTSSPDRVTRLVSLPASCVAGEAECPEAQVIETPVALTASLQPMVWSPKRNEAAWVYPITEDQRIWTLYLFNGDDRTWTDLASYDRYLDPPMWSRDGAWLAYRLQDGQGGNEIYAIRRDGTDMKILTDNPDLPAEGEPYVMDTWLGENVVLRSGKPGQSGTIYLVRVEDGKVTPLFDTLLTKAQFTESPDGTLLGVVDYDYVSQKQVVKIITPDGQTFRELASFASGSVNGLTWSANGRQLGFIHRTDASVSVYVIDSDGRNLRQAYTAVTDAQFTFSPDGNYLLVQTIDGTGEHLYSVYLPTLEARLVQVPGIALYEAWMYPAWRP